MSINQQYIIEQFEITAERFPDKPIDIASSIVELNIYEHLELPYLTAKALVNDPVGLYSYFGSFGTERVKIKISITDTDSVIEKNFIITSLEKSVQANEKSSVHLFNLMEEHAYLSNVMTASAAFEGDGHNIITQIITGYLEKQISVMTKDITPAQPPFRYLMPYITPLEAAERIRDRITTNIGAPYFLYAKLQSDNLQLSDMEYLISKDPWNKSRNSEYIFSQSAANNIEGSSTFKALRESFFIQQWNASNVESTLKTAKAGAIGSNFSTVDINTGEAYNYFHNGIETLKQLAQENLPIQEIINVSDDILIGRDQLPVSYYPARTFSAITSGIFDDMSGYHDHSNNPALYLLKIKSQALRTLLLRNMVQIVVPGLPYIVSNQDTIGSKIRIRVPLNTVNDDRSGEVDTTKSGDYMIYTARHMFKNRRYDISMNISKLTNLKT